MVIDPSGAAEGLCDECLLIFSRIYPELVALFYGRFASLPPMNRMAYWRDAKQGNTTFGEDYLLSSSRVIGRAISYAGLRRTRLKSWAFPQIFL